MRLSWRSASGRGLLYQAAALLVVVVLGWFLASNTAYNMAQRGIQSGFDFLWDPAGFEIGEGLFNFDSTQSYALAFLTGLGNTVRVAVTGIVLATLLGTVLRQHSCGPNTSENGGGKGGGGGRERDSY